MYNLNKIISGYRKLSASSINDEFDTMGARVYNMIQTSRPITMQMITEYYVGRMQAFQLKNMHATILCLVSQDRYDFMSNEVSDIVGDQALLYTFACIEQDIYNFLYICFSKRKEFNAAYSETEWWKKSEEIVQYLCKIGDDPIIEKTPGNDECLIGFEPILDEYVECTGPVPHCFDVKAYDKYKVTVSSNNVICPYDRTYKMNSQRFTVPH